IKSNVRVVLVPVVVRDVQGHTVGNLRKEDFEVFDRGKPQEITGFTIQKRKVEKGEANTLASAPGGPSVAAPRTPPERFIVFLFDDMHLATGDLVQAQQAADSMLAESLADSDMAEVVSTSGSDSGLTQDRGVLEKEIIHLRMHTLYRGSGMGCPKIDYYQGDLIEKGDDTALETAIDETMSCAHIPDRETAQQIVEAASRQAVELGDQDVRVTLGILEKVVHKMGTLPGQRMLILVSPGFLTTTSNDMMLKSEILDEARQANVTISALDAGGLYTTGVEADEGLGNLPVSVTRAKIQYHQASMSINEAVMAELADGSGGTYFHNDNDLAGGFNRLTLGPDYVYLLEFSADKVKQDGTYHNLDVKVDQKGLKLESRRGYFAPKHEKTKG
ncbi:MAG: VWA domain-containing protein, partial [Candidatus Acidiferrum sp.]